MFLPPLWQALTQIEQCLRAIAPDVVLHLRSGLSPATIAAKVAHLPCQLPTEVYVLFQWHDGSDPQCPVQLLPNYSFLSLDEALTEYAQTIAIYENLGIDDWQSLYHPFWFPLFASEGSYYLVPGRAIGVDEDLESAPILDFFNEEPETPIVFDSLTALMQAIAACWQAGVYRVEPLGMDQWQTVGDDRCDRLWLPYQPQRAAQIAAILQGQTTELTPEQQRQGYMDLVAMQPETALPILTAELATHRQTAPDRCFDLIHAIGRLQTPAAAASLLPYLNDNNKQPSLRAAVVMTLVWTVPAPILQQVPNLATIVPPLLSMLREDAPQAPSSIRDVAMLLGRIGDTRAVAPLLATLAKLGADGGTSMDPLTIAVDRDGLLAIVASLGQLGDAQAAGPLFELAQSSADATVQRWATNALRQLGDDRGFTGDLARE